MNEYFYLNEVELFKLKSKAILIYFIVSGLFGVLFANNISIILKGIFLISGIFLFITNWYRVKYFYGVKKNPFELNRENKTIRYYNEFRGVNFINIENIRNMTFYSRQGAIYLIEVGIKGLAKVEDINTEGLSSDITCDMINKILKINPNILTKTVDKTKKQK